MRYPPDDARPHLSIQLHNVCHLVPTKAHESGVIAGTVPWHHHVRLIVGCPLHAVWGLGLPPAGIVSGCMAPGPFVGPKRETLVR